jgi:hypothetical protein
MSHFDAELGRYHPTAPVVESCTGATVIVDGALRSYLALDRTSQRTSPDAGQVPDAIAPPDHDASVSVLSSRSPFRHVDWRYRRAIALHTGQLEYRARREDAWVRLALALLQGRRVRGGVERRFHAAEANRLRFASGSGDVRVELEARLLAGQDDSAIAARLELSPGVVAAYERLFFDVRDVLEKPDYIMKVVLGSPAYIALRTDDLATITKYYGYTLGPMALDYLLRYLGFPGVPVPVGSSPEFEVELAHHLDLANAARSLTVDRDEAVKVVRVVRHMDEIVRNRSSRDHATVMASMALTDDPIPWIELDDNRAEPSAGRLVEQSHVRQGDLPPVIETVDVDAARGLPVRATA